MSRQVRDCAVCRFMRALAFSAVGGGISGYAGLALGLERPGAMVAAFFGALGAVVWAGRRSRRG